VSSITPQALARRRILGAVLLLAGTIVAAIVIWPNTENKPSTPEPTPAVRLVSIPPLGLALAHPSSWKRKIDKRIVRLTSPEGSVVLTVASPLRGRHPAQVKAALINDLRNQLQGVKIVHQGPASVGVVQVSSVELTGRVSGKLVRVLGMVSSTSFRTYAITLVTAARPSARRLAQARGILQTIRFGEPTTLGPIAPPSARKTTTTP
jgi:hypothetical protein